MVGNVKFIWIEFRCADCGKTFSINEIREKEKNKYKRKCVDKTNNKKTVKPL